MSITQGLAELKLLDKRINKCLGYVEWAQVRTKTKKVDETELKRIAQSEYQSYMDLVKRRDTIKRAIVLSNAETSVTIGTGTDKWQGTVAEAIEHKSSIAYKKKLLEKMKMNISSVDSEYASATDAVEMRLDTLLSSELGKDVKTNPETIAALRASFKETNKVELVDPVGLKQMTKALEDEIDAFETNVDWVLSEANGKTMINLDSKTESRKTIPKAIKTLLWNKYIGRVSPLDEGIEAALSETAESIKKAEAEVEVETEAEVEVEAEE